jgi:hypothetical protein
MFSIDRDVSRVQGRALQNISGLCPENPPKG